MDYKENMSQHCHSLQKDQKAPKMEQAHKGTAWQALNLFVVKHVTAFVNCTFNLYKFP